MATEQQLPTTDIPFLFPTKCLLRHQPTHLGVSITGQGEMRLEMITLTPLSLQENGFELFHLHTLMMICHFRLNSVMNKENTLLSLPLFLCSRYWRIPSMPGFCFNMLRGFVFFLLSPLLGNSDEISFRTFFKLKSTFRIYSIGSGTTVIIIKALHIWPEILNLYLNICIWILWGFYLL